MLNRRSLLVNILAAPVIIRTPGLLMPIKLLEMLKFPETDMTAWNEYQRYFDHVNDLLVRSLGIPRHMLLACSIHGENYAV